MLGSSGVRGCLPHGAVLRCCCPPVMFRRRDVASASLA